MKLSLQEASRLLGITTRQARSLIKAGRLPARKETGRWVLEESQLEITEGQRRAAERKVTELVGAVQDALGPHLRRGRTYSVRDVHAFARAVASCRTAAALPTPPAAAAALSQAAIAVAQGCHRFHGREKAAAFRDARERAAEAVALLHIAGDEQAAALADQVESDFLPVLSGLVRRAERRAQP